MSQHEWKTPVPFDTQTAMDINADVLSGTLRAYVKALATAAEVPESLPLMTVLGVVSTCVSKRYVVQPKPGWQEPVNIYAIVALPPANNKSLILRRCLAPLVAWEEKQCTIVKNAQKKQVSERRSLEKIIEAKRKKLERIENAVEQRHAIQEIVELESELPEITPLPKLFTNDVTPESLRDLLAEQNGNIAIFSDEAGVLETLSGLYTRGSANIDVLLKGIDGGHTRIRRQDREYDLNPYLTLMLAIQPKKVIELSQKRAFTGNGALERILYVIPHSTVGYRSHDTAPVSEEIEQAYHTLITRLLNAHHARDGTTTLTLSPEAEILWKRFQQDVEIQLRRGGKLYPILGWGGKICGFSLRLSGLLHIATETPEPCITGDTMTQALRLASQLIDHALVAYGMMGADEAFTDARELWEWMDSQRETQLKRSEITTKMRNRKMGKTERLTAALNLLVDMGYLAKETENTRKPTTVYTRNPLARKTEEKE